MDRMFARGSVTHRYVVFYRTDGLGTSSGLHHDYHDNLYIVLRGSKQFSLFPANDATQMYTHGTIKRLHSNGRIVYEGQVDGSAMLLVGERFVLGERFGRWIGCCGREALGEGAATQECL